MHGPHYLGFVETFSNSSGSNKGTGGQKWAGGRCIWTCRKPAGSMLQTDGSACSVSGAKAVHCYKSQIKGCRLVDTSIALIMMKTESGVRLPHFIRTIHIT